tara:strand:+ start:20 stop:880 length:861 start_codon:yes stop_codon:yes gene_type:complete
MIKIMITGASGMLGTHLCLELQSNFQLYPFVKTESNIFNKMNINNIDEVSSNINTIKPDVIINCAAYTNVDNAEENKSEARNVNVLGLLNIIKSSSKNTKIIHISTDYVFDGDKGSYLENDIKNPLNYYGKTKLEAENYLIGSNLNYLIIRPNVLYTYGLGYMNFFSWVLSSLNKNKKINVASDQISNPVFIPDLVSLIRDSILVDYSGICHFGSEDVLSRYDFAVKISEIFKLNKGLIKSVETAKLKQKALRPLNTSLNCSKVESDLDIDLLSTQYSLKRIYSHL